ncbi:MAG: 2OG-Fe(II) oxygenase family protein [Bacteroidota bacterium]
MGLHILNKQAIEKASFRTYPYKLGTIEHVVHKSYQKQLLARFPESNFTRVVKSTQDKSYEMNIRPILKPGSNAIVSASQLDSLWIQLIEELKSAEYRNLISTITGISLDDCEVEVNLWKYTNGSNLSVHKDKDEKVVTHLIYMNDIWKDSWGGHFCIHTEKSQESICEKILPVVDNSLILITTNNSWHSVAAVKPEAHSPRKGLQIIFKSTSI